MQEAANRVISKIYGMGRGWVFTPNDFVAFGSRAAIDKALSRLATDGTIRRLNRGLYDYPKTHPVLGILSPNPEAVAKALKGEAAVRIKPFGAYAANVLGITEQVPAKIVFLTDGTSKTVRVGKQEIRLKHTTPKNMATAGKASGLVIEALRELGKAHIDQIVIAKIRERLGGDERKQLLKNMHYAPEWMRRHLRSIAGGLSK
jgi:hypothetical protein